MPPEGKEKPPSVPGNPRVNPRLQAAGAAVGCDFTGKCDRYPNTILAHVLTEYAATKGKSDEVAELLFQYNFRDGHDVTLKENLLKIAATAGLDMAEVERALSDPAGPGRIKQEVEKWRRRGVTGVPAFFVNGHSAFSGAQDPQAFIEVFEQATQ
mmetsp:Transcript_4901/g.11468  ORF Transcript_4901/g.11468 Transcript_4901/m.11468 type:complete len:155 (-) Transcript_4901:262-726(-)